MSKLLFHVTHDLKVVRPPWWWDDLEAENEWTNVRPKWWWPKHRGGLLAVKFRSGPASREKIRRLIQEFKEQFDAQEHECSLELFDNVDTFPRPLHYVVLLFKSKHHMFNFKLIHGDPLFSFLDSLKGLE